MVSQIMVSVHPISMEDEIAAILRQVNVQPAIDHQTAQELSEPADADER